MTQRLLLSYLAVTVLVLVVLGVPLSLVYADHAEDRFVSQAREDALILGASFENALEQDLPLDRDVADDYAARTGNAVLVVDRDGDTRLDTDGRAAGGAPDRPEIRQALSGVAATPRHSSSRNVEYIAMPITSGSTVRGAVRLAVNHEPVDAENRRFRLELTVIAAAVVGIAALLGWAIARSVSEPIRRLTGQADRLAAGQFTATPDSGRGPPEVRALADAMETMAAQLDELLRSQRRFVADASHQLRTPLTAVRLRLGNVLDAPDEERRAELEATIDEVDRTSELVTSLLALAHADEHHDASSDSTVTDLAAAVRDRADTWSAVAEATDVRLVADIPDVAVDVHAGTAAVEQIIDNLLDNALLASPAGSTVGLRVESDGHQHRLTVIDEGSGLSDDEKQMATQRFWRGDLSRSGTGLGLSIVDSLVRSSHGTLLLADAPDGGLAVTVAFRSAHRDHVAPAARSQPAPASSSLVPIR